MKERIEAILKHEGISPSKLADLLGVQRSGMSHILSGRNKPSLDFLNKLLLTFPHISGDWVVTGQGSMLKVTNMASKNADITQQASLPFNEPQQVKNTPEVSEKKELKEHPQEVYKTTQTDSQAQAPLKQMIPDQEDKTIERIVVFYSDRTFIDYRPD